MSYLDRWRRNLARPYRVLNQIELSRSALLHNYDLVGEQHPDLAVMPVLKANAYGHGLLEVAQILQARDFPYLIVDGYFEALKLRRQTKRPILVMGYIDPHNYSQLRTNGLSFVVHDRPTIEALGRLRRSVTVHLEINTGMNRHGIAPDELGDYLALLKNYSHIKLEGVMSHLADADGERETYTAHQVALFDRCVEQILAAGFDPRWIHLAQTAGSQRQPSRYANALRLGIGLYGINPFDPKTPEYPGLADLKPVLTLTSTITKVIELAKGQKVSYNGIFTAAKDTTIGVLPLGYYEGLPRALSNVGVVKQGDDYLPIVGRVCMNHTMVELKGTKTKYLDRVTVISNNPTDRNSVAGLGREHGLFSYELLVGLNESIRRVMVD